MRHALTVPAVGTLVLAVHPRNESHRQSIIQTRGKALGVPGWPYHRALRVTIAVLHVSDAGQLLGFVLCMRLRLVMVMATIGRMAMAMVVVLYWKD